MTHGGILEQVGVDMMFIHLAQFDGFFVNNPAVGGGVVAVEPVIWRQIGQKGKASLIFFF